MFEAKLAEAGILKKVLEAIKELLNEAVFDCSAAGVQLQAMDSSHVSLVSLHLKSEGFERYRCDRNRSMGLNLASFVTVMKCCNKNDVVTLMAQDNVQTLTVVFESKNEDQVSHFDMKLMRLDQEHLGIPEADYACVVKMPSDVFAKVVKDLSPFGDSISIACSKDGVKFSSKGDMETANIKFVQGSNEESSGIIHIDLQDPITLLFASKYLNLFAKAAVLSDNVTLYLSHDYPLMVEFKIKSKKKNYGYIRYYLAQKFEHDDI